MYDMLIYIIHCNNCFFLIRYKSPSPPPQSSWDFSRLLAYHLMLLPNVIDYPKYLNIMCYTSPMIVSR